MNRRTVRVVAVVVALLAIVPHLPSWYPIARDAVAGVDWHQAAAAIATAARAALAWVALNARAVEIGGAVVLGVVIAFLLTRVRRRQRRAAADSGIWVMPRSITIEPSPRQDDAPVHQGERLAADAPARLRTTRPDTAVSTIATVAEVKLPRRPGVLQPAERESRRAMVCDLFQRGRSVSEIARITGIGQDAIRATVQELRSA